VKDKGVSASAFIGMNLMLEGREVRVEGWGCRGPRRRERREVRGCLLHYTVGVESRKYCCRVFNLLAGDLCANI